MMSLSRMIPRGLIVLGLCTSGCSTRPTLFGTPQSRAGNAASHGEPGTDRVVAKASDRPAGRRGTKLGDATHLYVNQRVTAVARPARYSESELAHVEVWWTENNGFHWRKAGHFEQGQTFFSLNVKEDGDYGVRFVGPDEEPAQRVLAYPERIYHVDTVQPEVQALVDPEKTDYHVGDLVSIDWMSKDYQLEKQPVTIEVLRNPGDADNEAIEFQRDLPNEGSVTYRIPPEALGGEITFRVEARDRAGNVGLMNARTLHVVENPMEAAVADAEAGEEAEADANAIDSEDRVAVADSDPEMESDVAAPVEGETPALVIGPILIPLVDTVQKPVTATATESDPCETIASADTAAQEQRGRKLEETSRINAIWFAAEVKTRAKMIASHLVSTAGDIVDRWVASARLARIEKEAAPHSPEPVLAVASVEPNDAEVDNTTDAWKTDQEQDTQLPPTFAVVEQPFDESAAEPTLQDTAVASAAQTDADETGDADTDFLGSMFLEFGPPIVTTEDPFEEPAPTLPPSDEPAAVAISDAVVTNNQDDSTADMPQADQHTQDAPSLAAADEEVADDVENASPDGAARRSSDLPFATAIARLPAIDPQMMGDEPAASEDVPADDTATTDPDASESPAKVTEPTPEEDTHPQVSALASAEQEADHEEQPQDVSVARDLQDDDEQIADAAVAEATDDNAGMNDVEDSPAAVEAVASVDQTEDEEPFLPAESIESLTTVDPTHGNGLLVPMPATLEDGAPTAHATAHPWRILGRQSGSTEKTIWSLPERQSDVGWRPVFADRSHADGPTEAGNVKPPKLAGTTEEMIDRKAPDQP